MVIIAVIVESKMVSTNWKHNTDTYISAHIYDSNVISMNRQICPWYSSNTTGQVKSLLDPEKEGLLLEFRSNYVYKLKYT